MTHMDLLGVFGEFGMTRLGVAYVIHLGLWLAQAGCVSILHQKSEIRGVSRQTTLNSLLLSSHPNELYYQNRSEDRIVQSCTRSFLEAGSRIGEK